MAMLSPRPSLSSSTPKVNALARGRLRRRRPEDWLPLWAVLGLLGGGVLWGGLMGHGWHWLPLSYQQRVTSPVLAGRTASPHVSAAPLTVPAPQVPHSEDAPPLPVVRSPLTFADVDNTLWAKPYIDALTARGVLNGLPEGLYAPNRPMTRAELAVQLTRAFDLAAIAPAQRAPFWDVSADFWGAAPIQEAVNMGFMTGYPEGDFRPSQTVSRVELFTALATGLNLVVPPHSAQTLKDYADFGEIPFWAQDKVAAVRAAGIISPSSSQAARLRPHDPATRAEVAALIYNTLAYMGKVEPAEKLLSPSP